jgi:hypothetical protein
LSPFTKWMGLHKFPKAEGNGTYFVPYPQGHKPDVRMGFSILDTNLGRGFTFSCAACHSSDLFGKKIIGMTNRFPRANKAFHYLKPVLEDVSPEVFQFFSGATDDEVEMLKRSIRSLLAVESKMPLVLGLDTSLAHVALSMSHRSTDAYASRDSYFESYPRTEILRKEPADSKPAVWWNMKYKNRWLSDGSLISGNPLFTNILWNEIGRGTDLRELETWFAQNKGVIDTLTATVFANEAPLITDFFSIQKIDVEKAKRGEKTFLRNCSGCHGQYQKAWSLPDSSNKSQIELIKTIKVIYHASTPVIDVGTDPMRYLGMVSLAKVLNPLQISTDNHISIRPQKGYVPPPLVGIWARWPYFHNNSAPSLCAVLTRHEKRPKTYYVGEASDPNRDFDFQCNGYPIGSKTPTVWKSNQEAYVDTRLKGLSNSGHDEGIFLSQGKEIMSVEQKMDLIHFLQTL